MSDNVSVIDAIKLIAKATKEDSQKMSDMAKGALHADQIDDLRLMLSRARDGSVMHGTATAPASAASAAAGPRDTSVQRRAWKGSANKASAKYQGVPPSTSEGHFPLRYRRPCCIGLIRPFSFSQNNYSNPSVSYQPLPTLRDGPKGSLSKIRGS